VQEGPRLIVSLSGGTFNQISGQGNVFEGRVEPRGLTFKLGSLGGVWLSYYDYHIGIPNLAELLSTHDYFTYIGTALTTATPAGISGPLDAQALLFTPAPDGLPITKAICWSDNHQFTLTPRGASRSRHE